MWNCCIGNLQIHVWQSVVISQPYTDTSQKSKDTSTPHEGSVESPRIICRYEVFRCQYHSLPNASSMNGGDSSSLPLWLVTWELLAFFAIMIDNLRVIGLSLCNYSQHAILSLFWAGILGLLCNCDWWLCMELMVLFTTIIGILGVVGYLLLCASTYGTCYKKLYEIRRNPRKFRAESAKLLCSYPRNCSTTSAESVSHFRRMILRYPQNDTSLSAEWYFAIRGMILRYLRNDTSLSAEWYFAVRRMTLSADLSLQS